MTSGRGIDQLDLSRPSKHVPVFRDHYPALRSDDGNPDLILGSLGNRVCRSGKPVDTKTTWIAHERNVRSYLHQQLSESTEVLIDMESNSQLGPTPAYAAVRNRGFS